MAGATAGRQSFVDRLMPLVYKIAGPLTKFGSMPFVTAITNAMAGTISITMIGSLALVLYLLCSDGGLTKTALIPFLKPFSGQIVLIQSLSLGILAPYLAVFQLCYRPRHLCAPLACLRRLRG